MLEIEIKNLTEVIKALVIQLEKNRVSPLANPEPEIKTEPKPEIKTEPKPEIKTEPKPEIKTEPKPEIKTNPRPKSKPKPEPKPEPKSEVTDKELMDLCLAIVRKDRTKKAKIKEIISSFGGDLISEIDPARYPELKKELEGLL